MTNNMTKKALRNQIWLEQPAVYFIFKIVITAY
jgi:hypothetical protein